jgi:hypothetical protein
VARGKILPEGDIQALERMVGHSLTDHLSALTHEDLQKLFTRMLSSFRVTARVANAAWLYAKDPTEDSREQLFRCLADYAPNYFTRHAADLEVLVDEFTIVYEDSEAMGKEELREMIGERLKAWSNELAKAREQSPPRTPR